MLLLWSTISVLAAPGLGQSVRIGIILDGPWEFLAVLEPMIREELEVLTQDEFDIRFDARDRIEGNWDFSTIESGFERLVADPEVDVVLCLGLISSQLALSRPDGFDKPVVAPLAFEPSLIGTARVGPGSGIRNLSFVVQNETLRTELDAFARLMSFERVALVVNREFLDALPNATRSILDALDGAAYSAEFIGVSNDPAEALQLLPEEADAVYAYPLLMDEGAQRALIRGLNDRGLPTFSTVGSEAVEMGMLASLRGDDRVRLARRTALNIQRILLGDAPEEIPVALPAGLQLVVNMETARTIGAHLPWDALLEAELLNEQEQGLRRLDLAAAARMAVQANLSLSAQEFGVDAAALDIDRARAALRPSISSSFTTSRIDEDRAASVGEQTTSASLQLDQTIYAEPLLANRSIAEFQVGAERAGLAEARLDVALEASEAYLNLLRALNLKEVRRSNLERTRANAALADVRRQVGAAAAGEIYRWRSQLAVDRQTLIDAEAGVDASRVALNRVLHLPLEERLDVVDVSLDDSTVLPPLQRFETYISTPFHFALLRDFAVARALETSPALQQVDALVAAQGRFVTSQRRSFWLPSVGARASLDERLSESGVGSEIVALLPSTSWSVALVASLPLYSGGERSATLRQAELQLEQLEGQRAALAERIEEGVRSANILTRSAYARTDLAREAAEAAEQNLELVQDAYARGAVNILELLDAQNAALEAQTSATDTRYDFFINLMRLQRATSSFDFFVDEVSRELWFRDLEVFFGQKGATP